MKRDRKEKHAKACKIAQAVGAPRPPMPESTEEEDSSSGKFNFSESDALEVVTATSPPPAHRGAGGEGSRTSNVLLPQDVAARRARSALAEFPSNSEDLWKIKMRPEEGYLSVVSLVFSRCQFWAVSFTTSCS